MLEPRHILDTKKQHIETHLIELFSRVRQTLEDTMRGLHDRDKAACREIVEHDPEINEAQRKLERECLVTLASQQPVAHDLRDIVAYMRISTELERMADYSSDIADGVLQMNGNDIRNLGLDQVEQMWRTCLDMLNDVCTAFQERDTALARRAATRDDIIDQAQQRLVAQLFADMQTYPVQVPDASRMLWIAHNLERCGDRATNIAEQVVFMMDGETVDLN